MEEEKILRRSHGTDYKNDLRTVQPAKAHELLFLDGVTAMFQAANVLPFLCLFFFYIFPLKFTIPRWSN